LTGQNVSEVESVPAATPPTSQYFGVAAGFWLGDFRSKNITFIDIMYMIPTHML
jgi:hypothetical protein